MALWHSRFTPLSNSLPVFLGYGRYTPSLIVYLWPYGTVGTPPSPIVYPWPGSCGLSATDDSIFYNLETHVIIIQNSGGRGSPPPPPLSIYSGVGGPLPPSPLNL